ncbi:DUF6457 domain-containing protein [Kibdelosporangium phytohabitans]|uniref:DUF6457 domain-containing protein n=1 Tax=Kibdelosporangium phytohabitans TaxID=860235 RepID=A0A0N9HV45_9PSEU|nr:DUF6457 domain-containing protein [Kibdelosporangium phytohabitans]ALG11194.1 hypothetical protein AOZ06_33785 [Kibdelosporangium phytohabitans]MBE1462457.1 hypothetical protein [Kibdelosporangium phytohabitans]
MRFTSTNARVLDEWARLVAVELGVGPDELDKRTLVSLARCVARDVGGMAAPLACYLLGIAVGQGMPLSEAASRVSTVVEQWRGPDWAD